jgi:hypothetical protein
LFNIKTEKKQVWNSVFVSIYLFKYYIKEYSNFISPICTKWPNLKWKFFCMIKFKLMKKLSMNIISVAVSHSPISYEKENWISLITLKINEDFTCLMNEGAWYKAWYNLLSSFGLPFILPVTGVWYRKWYNFVSGILGNHNPISENKFCMTDNLRSCCKKVFKWIKNASKSFKYSLAPTSNLKFNCFHSKRLTSIYVLHLSFYMWQIVSKKTQSCLESEGQKLI